MIDLYFKIQMLFLIIILNFFFRSVKYICLFKCKQSIWKIFLWNFQLYMELQPALENLREQPLRKTNWCKYKGVLFLHSFTCTTKIITKLLIFRWFYVHIVFNEYVFLSWFFFIYFRELQENLIRSHSAGKTLCLIIVYVSMPLDIFIPTDYPLHLAFTVQWSNKTNWVW